MNLSLAGTRIGKNFNRRVIFRDISFLVRPGETLLVTGRNGSGKSTLIKIIAGILSPTEGTISFGEDSAAKQVPLNAIGFVSPYLTMYEEFTPVENLRFALECRGIRVQGTVIFAILERVGLSEFAHVPARYFSSGMKQRLKYAFSVIHEPAVLLLDEPTSNLDDEGKSTVREIMDEQRRKGILVVATNERTDLTRFDHSIALGGGH